MQLCLKKFGNQFDQAKGLQQNYNEWMNSQQIP